MSVEDLSSGKEIEKGSGKVFVVDPNPINNEIIPPEDMFIYVKFSATPKSRVTYNGNDFVSRGVEDDVNFISTNIRYNPETGSLNPNPQSTYTTTDWTNIGAFRSEDTKSAGVLEGFGIKSINIKYNASLVPVVDITFTDVRGSALFDVIEDNDMLSPYSVFFKMPYPVFKLSIKGYFGQKVDYCLHMTNWNSQFDGSTGNFDISANFLGFQQAFLNDMVIGNIIGVINTEEGYSKLNKIFEEETSTIGLSAEGDGRSLEELRKTGKLNVRKLDDFFTRISKLKVESESLKTELNSFKTLKFLNGKLSILKEIQSFLGIPIKKVTNSQSNEDETSKNYLEIKNNNVIDGSVINDKILIKNQNYLSIRDFLLINVVNINSFVTYINSFNDIIKKYNEYINGNDNKKYKNSNSLDSIKDKDENVKGQIKKVSNYLNTIRNPKSLKSTKEDDNFISLFTIKSDEDSWKDYIIPSQINNGNLNTTSAFNMSNVLEEMYNENSVYDIYLKSNYDDNDPPVNNEFDIESFKNRVNSNGFYDTNGNFTPDTVVGVVDFRKERALLEKEIQELKKIIKIQKELVQTEFNNELFNKSNNNENVFKPTIKNCFEVLANNTQAMVETIYDITVKSESKDISQQRKNVLSSYSTDIPPSLSDKLGNGKSGIAWPSVYSSEDGGEKEVYIGEIAKSNRDIFPEYDFVERVFENFISKRKELKLVTKESFFSNGLDTDNWYPLNPIDYKENPFIKLRFLGVQKEIKEYFVEQMLTRIALLTNYSLFTDTTGGESISSYARFDALNAYETVRVNNNTVLNLSNIITEIKNETIPFGSNSLVGKTNFYKNRVEESESGPITQYNLLENDNFPKISGVKFGLDYSNENNEYILFGKNNSEIINNSKSLWSSIRETSEFTKITDNTAGNKINVEKNSGELFYKTNYSIANNLNTNNIINVWDKTVATNIFNSNEKKISPLTSKIKLTDIDILNKSGDTIGIYLNRTYFNPNSSSLKYEDFFTNEEFYDNQTIFGRAYLILSSIPFRSFKEGFLNSVFPDELYSGARIVQLPSLYLYYLGSLLWRYNETTDPINWSGKYSQFETNKNKYLTKISYYKTKNSTEKELEEELVKLPKSVTEKLINKFKVWVESNNFTTDQNGKFEKNINDYVSNTPNDFEKVKRYILNELVKNEELIILNPNIFNKVNGSIKKLKLSIDDIRIYIDKFAELFTKKSNENSDTSSNDTSAEDKKISEENKTQLKLQIYNYFKNINDKWVAGNSDGKAFNVCGSSSDGGSTNKNLIEYFKFIDRGWRPIGSEAVINLNSFLSLGNNQDTSVYLFMSKLLRDSNFLFQILPTYINYKSKDDIVKIFRPQTTLETNDSSGPIYCCIYVGGASQVLDIKETNNYYFNNDGFAFKNGQLPTDISDSNKAKDGGDDFSLVAFRVAFGAQNQTIFKNVSLNQQEHKETGEYFRAVSDLIDKRGATQKTYQGTDLLKLFKTRSYTCKVDALGCMNIQPLMYFDLQNVPFFNGAYLITSVTHSITPNHMTTNFQGVRQSKYISPPVTSITADVDLDLTETLDLEPFEPTNLSNNNTLYSIGVNPEIANQPFEFENITIGNLKELGVSEETISKITNISEQIVTPLETAGITTNSDVSMFFANALANSNNFVREVFDFGDGDYVNSELKFAADDDNFPNKTIKYVVNATPEPISDEFPIFEELKKYNTYVPTASAETTTIYSPKIAYYFKGTDSKLESLSLYKGDAYLYRPTGYLYILGRKQYYDFLEGENPEKYNDINDSDYTPFTTPFNTTIKVWKEVKDVNNKSASDYAKSKNRNTFGTFTSFNQSIIVSQQYKGVGIEKSAKVFEKVLNTFTYKSEKLIDFFNP